MAPPNPLVDPRLAGYGLEPLAGGWSGETFLATPAGEPTAKKPAAGAGDQVVVQYFAAARHAEHTAEIQAALLGRVRDIVPVPAVHQVHGGDSTLPGLLVTELLAGERGDLVLARLLARDLDSGDPDPGDSDPGTRANAGSRADALRTMGRALGRIAGALAAVPMPQAGMFADATLRIEPFRLWLPAWVDTHAPGLAGTGWSDAEIAALRTVAERAAHDLDGAPPCLVHSDLNPKNVLVDPVTLEVTGVLDWEFAHAGHPATDLGNLLRFDREPAYVEGVLGGYLGAGPVGTGARPAGTAQGDDAGPGELGRRRATDHARAADLVALVELVARPATNPVVRGAQEHLRAIARSGDVHAVPDPDH